MKKNKYKGILLLLIMLDNSENIQKFITGKPNWSGAPVENRKSPWRYNEETGIYNNKPTDPEYFKKYMAIKVPCPCCSRVVTRGDLYKHKKRDICIKNRKVDN